MCYNDRQPSMKKITRKEKLNNEVKNSPKNRQFAVDIRACCGYNECVDGDGERRCSKRFVFHQESKQRAFHVNDKLCSSF